MGEDQLPLIEQCREIVRKFNSIYGETLKEPEAVLSLNKRIKGLDGNEKMGKSLGNAIYLSDSDEEITRKVMGALTDPNRIKKDDLGNPDICMVAYYHNLFSSEEEVKTVCEECKAGKNGEGSHRFGKSGEDLYIKVPIGTIVKDAETGKVVTDLSTPGQVEKVLPGGKGGKGNSHFATSTRQAPRFARDGEKGIEKEFILELKLLADVGLLGFPNVGKSTFISRVTSAKPKIADYHFTTLVPNLEVVKGEYEDSFVIADIPGIIEGASEGVGLGLQFLRHVEITRLLLHFLDVSGQEGRDPIKDFETINKELKKYSEKLAQRKQVIVANKIDVMQDDTLYKEVEKFAKEKGLEIFKISAATGEGIKELMTRISELLKELPKEEIIEPSEERVVYTLKEDKDEFDVEFIDCEYIVSGQAVERLMGRVNIQDNESMHYFQKQLNELGIEARLKKLGIKEGDTVKILEWEFVWYN